MPRLGLVEHRLAHLLPRAGFKYRSGALFPGRDADARAVVRAMKKGDQSGRVQPTVADKCLEELFVAARALAAHLSPTSTATATTLDKFWVLVLEEVGWGQVLASVSVAHLANHVVEARLRAKIEDGPAEDAELGLAAPAVDAYVHEMRRLGLEARLPRVGQTADKKDETKHDDAELAGATSSSSTITTTAAATITAAASATSHPAAELVRPLQRLELKRKRDDDDDDDDELPAKQQKREAEKEEAEKEEDEDVAPASALRQFVLALR